jgi:hypothetical protein
VAIESMRNPQKNFSNPSKGVSTPSKEKKEEASEATIIEDNVLGSMQGCVDTFISTYNNFYVRFPKLREEAYYRKQTLDILKNLKKYIEKVEGELK